MGSEMCIRDRYESEYEYKKSFITLGPDLKNYTALGPRPPARKFLDPPLERGQRKSFLQAPVGSETILQ